MQAKTKKETVSMPCKSETRALALRGLRDAAPWGWDIWRSAFRWGSYAKAPE